MRLSLALLTILFSYLLIDTTKYCEADHFKHSLFHFLHKHRHYLSKKGLAAASLGAAYLGGKKLMLPIPLPIPIPIIHSYQPVIHPVPFPIKKEELKGIKALEGALGGLGGLGGLGHGLGGIGGLGGLGGLGGIGGLGGLGGGII